MKIKIPNITPRNKSVALSCLAGIGVVATGWLSARSARKADTFETRKEKFVAYIPAIAAGTLTISCIGMSTYISSEEVAALTLTCAATAQKFTDYRKAVHENVSEEDERKINEAFYQKEIERLENELAEREHPQEDDGLCEFVDCYSGYTFRASYDDVIDRLSKVMETWKTDEALAWCQMLYILSGGDTKPYYSRMGCSQGFWGDYAYGWSRTMFEDAMGLEHAFENFDIRIEEVKDNPNAFSIEYDIFPEPDYMNI